MWTSHHLRRAVNGYLRLLESLQGKGRLTPETVLRPAAPRTFRATPSALWPSGSDAASANAAAASPPSSACAGARG